MRWQWTLGACAVTWCVAHWWHRRGRARDAGAVGASGTGGSATPGIREGLAGLIGASLPFTRCVRGVSACDGSLDGSVHVITCAFRQHAACSPAQAVCGAGVHRAGTWSPGGSPVSRTRVHPSAMVLLRANGVVLRALQAKAEFLNPGGSAKDRVARQIVLDAIKACALPTDGSGTIVEGTSGSTGISLALMARGTCGALHRRARPDACNAARVPRVTIHRLGVPAAMGLRCCIVMPDDQAKEKSDLLTMFGAAVERVKNVAIVNNKHYVNLARSKAAQLPGATPRPYPQPAPTAAAEATPSLLCYL